MSSGALVVFAKAPEPGRVKTRLTPPLTPDEAADLYACMLDDVLETTAQAAHALAFEAILTVDPPSARAALAARAPLPFRVVAQRGADLGARMEHAVAECAAGGAERIVLRGSDSPALAADTLIHAAEALVDADLVACPDPDGGYSVVGLRRPQPGLFDGAMSHAGVLEATLARAHAAGLHHRLLEPGFDLDTAEDLARLAHAGDSASCPRTRAWLDAHPSWASRS